MMTEKNRFPAGWDAERVNNLLKHYEAQSEDEAVAEAEEALSGSSEEQTVIVIPTE